MTNPQLLKHLKGAFEKNNVSQKSLADRIMPLIEKKVWATEPQIYLEPLKVEINRWPKGRMMKTEPEVKEYCTMMGLDKDGRLVYEERWEGHPARGYLRYYDIDGDVTHAYTFTRDGDLDMLEYQEKKDGNVTLCGNWTHYAVCYANTYVYDAGRIVAIETQTSYYDTIKHLHYTIFYDALGNVQRIERTDDPSPDIPEGQHLTIYQNSPYSLKKLTEIFTEETNAMITEVLESIDKEYLFIVLDRAFITDDWLPLKIYTFDGDKPLRADMPLGDLADFEALPEPAAASDKLTAISELLVQEIGIKEKFDLPNTLLVKAAKEAKAKAGTAKVMALDLYDDLELTVSDVLERVYSKKEIAKF